MNSLVRAKWILLLFAVILPGCSYPTVGPDAYELTKVLHTVCDRRSTPQLDQFAELLEQRDAAGKLAPGERELLDSIVAMARNEQWDDAKSAARELMLAQTE